MAPVACQRPGCFEPVTATLYQLCSRHWEEFNQGAFTIIKPDPKEVRTVSATGGEKNAKEEQAHHIPWQGIKELYRVATMGSEKYEDYNFRKGFPWSLSYDAIHRHINLWWEGIGFYDELVEKTGKWWRIHHLANAAWHCLVLIFFEVTGKYDQFDDRPWVSDIKRQVKEAYDVPGDQNKEIPSGFANGGPARQTTYGH